jgi:hypothetical protein
MNITVKENGSHAELKIFSAVPARVVAMWLTANRIFCTYPALPLEIHPGHMTSLHLFTDCIGVSQLSIVSTASAQATSTIDKVTVNFSHGFDPKRIGFPKSLLSYIPQVSPGFMRFGSRSEYLLALSGDMIIDASTVYSPSNVEYTPDIFTLYTELGALTAERSTLIDMQADQDLIKNIEQKIGALQRRLDAHHRRI